MAKTKANKPFQRRMRGFEAAATLVAQPVRAVGETRGFAVARLLTHWVDVVGPEIASRTRPVKISHGRGFGATLVLLVQGAYAPMIEMELPRIREKVNACYGFNAVSRITLTQTAATGFHEGQAAFVPQAKTRKPAPTTEVVDRADVVASGFKDPALAAAIRQLTLNTLSRRDPNDRKVHP